MSTASQVKPDARVESAIYEGRIRHRRYAPVRHDFSYRVMQLWLDLDELPEVFDDARLWSARGPALGWFRRKDFLGADEVHGRESAGRSSFVDLKEAVLDRVEEKTGERPGGPVRMLAHLRYFGYVFNPVVFYYCYDSSGVSVEAIVAEITNTPWKERHAYVLGGDTPACGAVHRFAKQFHISPFFDMNCRYEWTFAAPGEGLHVHMRNLDNGTLHFDSTLELERRPITARALNLTLIRFPLLTMRVSAAIYWQALRLRLKGVPFHTHPKKLEEAMEPRS